MMNVQEALDYHKKTGKTLYTKTERGYDHCYFDFMVGKPYICVDHWKKNNLREWELWDVEVFTQEKFIATYKDNMFYTKKTL